MARPKTVSKIHPTAVINKDVQLGTDVEIGPYVVIDGAVRIGDRTRIVAQAHLTGWTEIGADCVIYPFASLGAAPQDYAYGGQRAFCRIGNRVVIRECVTVHRGTKPDSETVVSDDCMLMATSHVAHNCLIGDKVVMANAVLLAGHVKIGHHSFIGGVAGVHQFVEIGEYAMVGGASEVTQNVAPFTTVTGRNVCLGINRVGLRRSEFPKADLDELRAIHHQVFRSPLGLQKAAAEYAAKVQTPSGRRIIDFVQSAGPRGVCASRHKDDDA